MADGGSIRRRRQRNRRRANKLSKKKNTVEFANHIIKPSIKMYQKTSTTLLKR